MHASRKPGKETPREDGLLQPQRDFLPVARHWGNPPRSVTEIRGGELLESELAELVGRLRFPASASNSVE